MAVEPGPAQRWGRQVARHGALDALSAVWRATGRQRRAVEAPRVHFPYLHAVPEPEEARFRQLLELGPARTHTFVTYPEAVDRVLTGRVDRPYLAFSFDDGFASNVRTARILEEYDARACFFVVTDFLGTPTLSGAREFFGYANAIDEPAMTWSDVEDMKARGHEIGNHTRTHRQISDLSPERVHDEIGTAAETLRRRLGRVEHFASSDASATSRPPRPRSCSTPATSAVPLPNEVPTRLHRSRHRAPSASAATT